MQVPQIKVIIKRTSIYAIIDLLMYKNRESPTLRVNCIKGTRQSLMLFWTKNVLVVIRLLSLACETAYHN